MNAYYVYVESYFYRAIECLNNDFKLSLIVYFCFSIGTLLSISRAQKCDQREDRGCSFSILKLHAVGDFGRRNSTNRSHNV